MNISYKTIVCTIVFAINAALSSVPASAGHILYVATSGTLNTNSGNWTPIPGLSFTLPIASATQKFALITLNVPNPYAQGNNFPGGAFSIAVNNAVLIPIAAFTSSIQNPPSSGRCPTTLVVEVPLTTNTQLIQAVWEGVRSSNVIMDTPASLSAVLE